MRALMLCSVMWATAAVADCPTRPSWPTKEWPVDLVDATAKADAIKTLETELFTLTGEDDQRKGLRTDGFVIIKHGKIVYEKYARGFDATKRHLSWSVAKSLSSTLVGVAVKQGALKLDDSICRYLSGYSGDVCNIRVLDTITFGTGLRWQEGYEHETYQTSSVISMLFGAGRGDMVRFVLDHEREKAPGTRWMYSTGDATLSATIARRALAAKFGQDAFWTLLFDKIGMNGATFEHDDVGNVLGGSHAFATPRDFARLGYLMLNDGCWDGERILPEGWVKAATTPSDLFVQSAPEGEDTPSGYAWWLNRPVPELKDAAGAVVRPAQPKPWPEVPGDAYGANGHWGQFIWVVPSEDVVIVRTGDDRNGYLKQGKAIAWALEVAR